MGNFERYDRGWKNGIDHYVFPPGVVRHPGKDKSLNSINYRLTRATNSFLHLALLLKPIYPALPDDMSHQISDWVTYVSLFLGDTK